MRLSKLDAEYQEQLEHLEVRQRLLKQFQKWEYQGSIDKVIRNFIKFNANTTTFWRHQKLTMTRSELIRQGEDAYFCANVLYSD